MKQFMFRAINRLGNSLSYRQSRFILNTLGLSKVIGLLARDQYAEFALPNGIAVTINPLLHASMEKEGRLNYESDVLEVVERYLGAGGVFYDVGANVGIFSFIAAAIVGEGGRVLAFEPEENNLVCFRRSLDRSNLKNIILYDLALGCEDGRMTFDRSGGAFSGHLAKSDEAAGGEAVSVKVRSIDSLVDSGAAPPTLLKIDVEGGEGAVLEGARLTLRGRRPLVLCEMHSFDPDGVGRAFSLLADEGYSCTTLDGARVTSFPPGRGTTCHVLATPG